MVVVTYVVETTIIIQFFSSLNKYNTQKLTYNIATLTQDHIVTIFAHLLAVWINHQSKLQQSKGLLSSVYFTHNETVCAHMHACAHPHTKYS